MNEVYEGDLGSYVTTENTELSEGSELELFMVWWCYNGNVFGQ